MIDGRNGCPERQIEPPENIIPPDWYDWADEIYQIFKDERLEMNHESL